MTTVPPFSTERLDELMAAAGLDVILATTKHNVRYLTGGYHNEFYSHVDAQGLGRYLPVVVYVRGRPDLTFFAEGAIGIIYLKARPEPLWVPNVKTSTFVGLDAARLVADWLIEHDLTKSRIGIESSFLPLDVYQYLAAELPDSSFVNALEPLEELRQYKSAAELVHVAAASEATVESMLATFAKHGEGDSGLDLEHTMKVEETARGLTFEYLTLSMGSDPNRAPSARRLQAGDVVSLDSGGQLNGYIGDLTRMGVVGEPDAQLEDLLAEIDAVQMAARGVVAPGTPGREIFAAAEAEMKRLTSGMQIGFVAHGMGLIGHEAPHLTDRGPVPYPATHADQPMAPGLVLSIESWMTHPQRGFIKLEDTIAVTPDGYVAYGDAGRGWNRMGQ